MLSLAKARKDYYLRKASEISPREDYYLRGGTATGRWHGSGAADIGLAGGVSAEELVRLFDGQHPLTGAQLGRRLRKHGVAAWDLTFSADKSVSLLWAFGDEETKRHVVEAFEEATAEAVSYLESVASSTRGAARTPMLDADGNQLLGEDGTVRHRIETWPIRTSGYVAAWFTEFTSRANDPQLHTHVVVGNRVKGVDDVWRAIDGRQLYRQQLAAGYLHEAELRSRLTERLGVRWQPVRNGMADIEGFTRDQIAEFSKRRQEIEAWRDSHGLADTPAANEFATLATRQAKRDHPLESLTAWWRERGAHVGISPETVFALLHRGSEITLPKPESHFENMTSENGLTAETSTFGRADVVKATAEVLPEGGRRAAVEALADAFLARSDVVPILPTQPSYTDLGDLPCDLTASELDHLLKLTKSTSRAHPMQRGDGETFPGLVHERRYTTTGLLAVEQRIVDRALSGIGAGRWSASQEQVEIALQGHEMLTNGQHVMVRQFATSGNAIDVGVGAAGTGKTAVMKLVGELANQTSTPIVGTALAARAAAGFESATGIKSATLTRFLWETKTTEGLRTGTVVVIDEAGMVGSRQLAAVSDLVQAASGKLILIGDHRQLAEIEAGGLFRALAVRIPAVGLTENVRQEHEWERTALSELRYGSANRAIAMYNRRGRVNIMSTDNDTISQAVDNWYKDVQTIGDPADVLLLAHRNTTVDQLNQQARALMGDAGLLQGPTLTIDDRAFQSGDRVVCLKNRSRLGVLNGDLATITAIDLKRSAVTLTLDRTNQTVAVPHWYLDDGYLDWGYALTGHKAQGATVRRSHTVVDEGVDREWIYVTMSRGQQANTLYLTDRELDHDKCNHLSHEDHEPFSTIIAALHRTGTEPAALDTGRGPQTITNEHLEKRLAQLKTAVHKPGTTDRSNDTDLLVEYLTLQSETEARHRDRLAEIAYEPPAWVVNTVGERPAEEPHRSRWDRVVDTALRYRTARRLPEDASGLLGPEPPSIDIDHQLERLRARRETESHRLTIAPERDIDAQRL